MAVKNSLLRSIGVRLANAIVSRRFWALYRELLAFEKAGPEARRQLRESSLQNVLVHAGTCVPFWQEQFQKIGVDPTTITPREAPAILAKLPVTHKQVYKKGYRNQVPGKGTRDKWRFLASSGTVDRLTIVTDARKRDYLVATLLRVNKRCLGMDVGIKCVEIPPQCCNVLCGMPDKKEGFSHVAAYAWRSCRQGNFKSTELVSRLRGAFRQLVLPRKVLLPIDPLPREQLIRTLDERIEQIAEADPVFIRALPVYLIWLADRLEQKPRSFPNLKAILPWGGLVTPAMAKRIERGFGVPFRDVYGATELGELAISCGHGKGLHVCEDMYELEVLGPDGQPVPDGQIGCITVTDFTNMAMPMIRYQLGDIGYAMDERCPCGRTERRIVVCGRLQEVIDTGNQAPATAYDLLELFFLHENVLNCRVDKHNNGLVSATVVQQTENRDEATLIADELGQLLKTPATPRVRSIELIRPEESGKYRFAHCAGTAGIHIGGTP